MKIFRNVGRVIKERKGSKYYARERSRYLHEGMKTAGREKIILPSTFCMQHISPIASESHFHLCRNASQLLQAASLEGQEANVVTDYILKVGSLSFLSLSSIYKVY